MSAETDEGPPLVQIHYLRPPDREQVYTQYLIHQEDGVKVTYARDLNFESPIRIAGAVVLETGSEAIWFTFPGAWHDIGLFHLADGSFTGTYANILTPCVFEGGEIWRTTDLFLDLWLDPTGAPSHARRGRSRRSGGKRMGRSGYCPARPGRGQNAIRASGSRALAPGHRRRMGPRPRPGVDRLTRAAGPWNGAKVARL